MSAECLHDDIETLRAANGGPARMWACRACHRRLYVACPICVDVGHRGAHVDRVATERARIRAELERIKDELDCRDFPLHYHGGGSELVALADIVRIVEGEKP